MLVGDEDLHVPDVEPEPLLCRGKRLLRGVVHFGEMREDDRTKMTPDLPEAGCRSRVGEVPPAGPDPPFQGLGVRARGKHLRAVVALEEDAIAAREPP